MNRFEVGTTVQLDDSGRIAWIHVGWLEARPLAGLIGWKLIVLGVGSTAIGYVVSLVGGGNLMMIAALACALAGLIIAFALPGKQRAVVLHADGSVETPCGTPWRPWETTIKGTHDRIVSIESRRQEQTGGGPKLFEVILISKRGSMVLLSHNCFEENAFGAAVQLTEALTDLRRQAADPNWMPEAAE